VRVRRLAVLAAAAAIGGGGFGPLAATSGDHKSAQELVVGLTVVKHGQNVIALAPITINGQGPFTFALDTGASRSLMDTAVARRLGIRGDGKSQKIAGVNSVSQAALVKLERWKVGQIELPATTVAASNIPFGNAYAGIQGLLGSGILSGFDVVTIDYRKQQLRLHPR
jgi:predicted aspartyl protease